MAKNCMELTTEELIDAALGGGRTTRQAAVRELERRVRRNDSSVAKDALEEIRLAENSSKANSIGKTPKKRGSTTRGCPTCRGKRACSGEHVYVIELSPEDADNERLLAANPKKNAGGTPVYVGYTAHTVECNFKHGHLGTQGDTYTCHCFEKSVERECNPRPSTTRWFTPMKLRYDLFSHLNPVEAGEGERNEKTLANNLRKKGYLVWCN